MNSAGARYYSALALVKYDNKWNILLNTPLVKLIFSQPPTASSHHTKAHKLCVCLCFLIYPSFSSFSLSLLCIIYTLTCFQTILENMCYYMHLCYRNYRNSCVCLFVTFCRTGHVACVFFWTVACDCCRWAAAAAACVTCSGLIEVLSVSLPLWSPPSASRNDWGPVRSLTSDSDAEYLATHFSHCCSRYCITWNPE